MARRRRRNRGGWSFRRQVGYSGMKYRFARKTGICTTRGGAERKLGRGCMQLLFLPITAPIFILVTILKALFR